MFPQFLLSLACALGGSAPNAPLSQYTLATVGGRTLPAIWQETEAFLGVNPGR